MSTPYQVMPPLSADEYEALKADIFARGVMVPVEYDEQHNILDGHHRVQICHELGITHWPQLIRHGLSEDEKRRHARRLNLDRRHLNSEQRRALIADELRERPEASDRSIATGLGVSHTTVGTVRDGMESTGQIGQLTAREGMDGRTRRVQFVSSDPEDRDPTISDQAIAARDTLPNGARSIMGSRHEPDDSQDYFPTPPFATRALIEVVFSHVGNRNVVGQQTAWEPACGEGHISEVLSEYFNKVLASDAFSYGYEHQKLEWEQIDFLTYPLDGHRIADWIITNPPFGDKAEQFVLRAIRLAKVGVAMFVRLQWLETVGRYETIFRDHPPTLIALFAERVALCKGRWNPDGGTATAYIWLVWIKGAVPQAPFWIPPGCRESLTKPDDRKRFAAWSLVADDGSPTDPDTHQPSAGREAAE